MQVGINGCHGKNPKGFPCGKVVVNADARQSLKSQYCPQHFKEQRRLARAVKRELAQYEEAQGG